MLAHELVLNPNEVSGSGHTPVLLQDVLRLTAPQPGEHVIDATLGAGGYSRAFLDAIAPDGTLLGIDRDAPLLQRVTKDFSIYGSRVQLVHGSFAALASIAKNFPTPDIIVADLGLSSVALDTPERGFSFLQDGPLDMRMDQSTGESAADLVNRQTESNLEHILKTFGEEPHSRQIARAIAKHRAEQPIRTTQDLATVIDDAYRKILHAPAGRKLWLTRGLHPATRTFQALRIAVNHELEQLEAFLPAAFTLLGPGGRLAVVSFHSLEDRIVKRFVQTLIKRCTCPPEQLQCTCGNHARAIAITRKPVQPSPEEVLQNPRSRSAKLRIIRKT